MSRAAWAVLGMVVAVGGASCRSCADLESFHPYSCDPDAGAGQCVSGRCNKATQTCFRPGVGAKVACVDGEDCGGGWRCSKVLQVCFAPDSGAAVACVDGQDCGDGWRCSQATATCFAPDAGVAAACQDALDCADGWRCSQATATCFSPAVGARSDCKDESDCATGWLCGPSLNGTVQPTCYDPDAGEVRPCEDDVHCRSTGGWFCDQVANQCAAVSAYQVGSRLTLDGTRLSPLRNQLPPKVFTMGRYTERTGAWYPPPRPGNAPNQFAGYVSGAWWPTGDGGVLLVSAHSDGLPIGGNDWKVYESAYPYPAQPVALAVVSGAVAALDPSGAVTLYSPLGASQFVDAGVPLVSLGSADHPLQSSTMFPVDADLVVYALALGNDGIPRRISSDGTVRTAAVTLPGSGPAKLTLGVSPDADAGWAFVAGAARSGWIDVLGDGGALPLDSLWPVFPDGGFTAAYQVARAHLPLGAGPGHANPMVLLELVRRDGGVQAPVTELLLAQRPPGPGAGGMFQGPSVACPCGAPVLAAWATRVQDPDPVRAQRVFARCAAVKACDGRDLEERTYVVTVWTRQAGDPLVVVSPYDESGDPWRGGMSTVDGNASAMHALAGPDGHLWHVQDRFISPEGAYGYRSVQLDRLPITVVRLQFAGAGPAVNKLVAFAEGYMYEWQPGRGFVSNLNDITNTKVPLRGNIAEEPTLAIGNRDIVNLDWIGLTGDSLPPALRLPTDAPDFGSFVGAWMGPRRLVLLTSRDTLYASRIPQSPFEPPGILVPIAVPNPGLPIRAFSGRETADGGIEAWSVTTQGLTLTTTTDEQEWRSTPQATLKDQGPLRRVWQDRTGSMVVGYASGLLTPAGSGAKLTSPFDGGVVLQYASLCDEAFALATRGVFRLSPEDQAGYRRVWEPVTAAPTLPWVNTQLNQGTTSLFLSTAGGDVFELAFARTDAGVPYCP